MREIKPERFGPIQGYELGYSPVGRPLMTTHIYLIDGLLIDTGQKHLRQSIAELVSSQSVNRILLTHHHEDHSGNAGHLQQELNIPILGHSLTRQKLHTGFPILPYQRLIWGSADPANVSPLPESIETEHYCLNPIHTPGHSKDHTAYWERQQGWLFSGDAYLGDRIRLFRADEQIKDEIESLKLLLSFDFDVLLCAHKPRHGNGKNHIRAKLDFLETVYENVAGLYHQGLPPHIIMKQLKIKEIHLLKWFCNGNISARNMILSVINALEGETATPPV